MGAHKLLRSSGQKVSESKSFFLTDSDNGLSYYMKAISFSLFRGVLMTNKILLLLIALSFIGIIMACLATVPSYGGIAHVEIPSNEIEILFVADK